MTIYSHTTQTGLMIIPFNLRRDLPIVYSHTGHYTLMDYKHSRTAAGRPEHRFNLAIHMQTPR